MKDYFSLGPAPASEDCVQVGEPDYQMRALKECIRYRNLLRQLYPEARFRVKRFPHDFGPYFEVVVEFDDSNDQEIAQAFEVDGCPYTTWEEFEKAVEEKNGTSN